MTRIVGSVDPSAALSRFFKFLPGAPLDDLYSRPVLSVGARFLDLTFTLPVNNQSTDFPNF